VTESSTSPQSVLVGAARIELQNLLLQNDALIDEVTLEGGDIRVDAPFGAAEGSISAGEVRVRAVMSEANVNRLITSRLSPDAPVRGVAIALLSGKARISGKALISIVPFPFSVDAVPRIENGARITLDFRTATLGIDLPRAIVDILEQRINEALGLDLSDLEIPVWIDELRCEPGRLTATGRARIERPPRHAISASGGAAARPERGAIAGAGS
jgi:hypothetical protein